MQDMIVPAQTKFIVISILLVLASVNFAKTSLEILQNSKRLDTLSQEVSNLEKEKETLQESISYKKTDAYVEEKARNDLNLVKPKEKVYVMPKEVLGLNTSTNQEGEAALASKMEELVHTNDKNITKWVRLITRN